ncbi:MAG: glycosyl transferase [Sphingobium sp.]|nr:MAG: glycosyl transferase [Sphingobium sp.]
MSGGRGWKEVGDRLDWVDAARGIGIVAVVVGHVWTRGALRDAVYSFHMPLFFLLSGYLFRARPLLPFAGRLLLLQGVSYVAFLALVVGIDILVEGSRGRLGIFHVWPRDLWRLAYGGSQLRGPFTVFWFVPCLVFARIAFDACLVRLPGVRGGAWLALGFFSLGLAYGLGWWTDVSPLGLLTVPMAFFLLWVGLVWRGIAWRSWMLALLLPLSFAGLFMWPTLNMKAGDYGLPLLSIGGAIATSFLVFRLARLWPFATPPVRYLGRASLVIMYLHVPVIHYLSWIGYRWEWGRPVLAAIALLLPLAVYALFLHTRFTRRLFLAE